MKRNLLSSIILTLTVTQFFLYGDGVTPGRTHFMSLNHLHGQARSVTIVCLLIRQRHILMVNGNYRVENFTNKL